jgi:hypothetical protein
MAGSGRAMTQRGAKVARGLEQTRLREPAGHRDLTGIGRYG